MLCETQEDDVIIDIYQLVSFILYTRLWLDCVGCYNVENISFSSSVPKFSIHAHTPTDTHSLARRTVYEMNKEM